MTEFFPSNMDHLAFVSKIAKKKRRKIYKQDPAKEKERARLHREKIRAENEAARLLIEKRREEEILREAAIWEYKNKQEFPDLVRIVEGESFKEWYLGVTGVEWREWLPRSPWFKEEVIYALLIQDEKRQKELLARRFVMAADLAEMPPAERRSALMKLAAPVWKDTKKILAMYQARDKLNAMFPHRAPFHVDHVIPMQGERVCGLHVHNNLVVIPGVENVAKKNKFSEENLHRTNDWSKIVL